MKRFPAAAALSSLLLLASGAFAQEFNIAGLSDIRARTLKQQELQTRLVAQEKQAAPPQKQVRVMGLGRYAFSALTADPGASADAAPDVSRYQVRGVDISHYQDDIAWNQVQTDGLSFVYIKATEGADGVDDKFAANWKGATSVGLAKGAYHFYNFCKTGAAQAANFIKNVPVEDGVLPMTVDLEESDDCKTMPAKAAFRASLAAFVQKVTDVYGLKPVLYVNYSIYQRYFQGEGDSYKLWIADTTHEAPALPDGGAWTVWQYGWHGAVAGIPGEVDLDVFNGTPEMLASLEQPSDIMVASLNPR